MKNQVFISCAEQQQYGPKLVSYWAQIMCGHMLGPCGCNLDTNSAHIQTSQRPANHVFFLAMRSNTALTHLVLFAGLFFLYMVVVIGFHVCCVLHFEHHIPITAPSLHVCACIFPQPVLALRGSHGVALEAPMNPVALRRRCGRADFIDFYSTW